MAGPKNAPAHASTEEATTMLLCLIDNAYRILDARGERRYESVEQLSDSEILTLAFLKQLRGVESESCFLRDTKRFFAHLLPWWRHRVRSLLVSPLRPMLRCFFVALRWAVLTDLGLRPGDVHRQLDAAFDFCVRRARQGSWRASTVLAGRAGQLLRPDGVAAPAVR